MPTETGGRSDLQTPNTPTGLPYGEHKKLHEAQQAVPLPRADLPSQVAAGNSLDQAHADAQATEFPPGGLLATLPPLDLPPTAGLPFGPGPGPEALSRQPQLRASDIFDQLAEAFGDPALAELAARTRSRGG